MHQVAEAVANNGDLNAADQQELLENIDVLAEEAAKEPEKRRSGVLRMVLGAVATSLATVADLATVWAAVGPTITHFFGA
jgi:hypothetical protein